MFIPEWCLHLDSLPAPFPLPTSPCVPRRCLTLMPACFLQSLPAAAGPLRQPRFPWLSLLLQAEGWLAALLQEPSSSHVNHKTLKKRTDLLPFSASFHPSLSISPMSTTPNLAVPTNTAAITSTHAAGPGTTLLTDFGGFTPNKIESRLKLAPVYFRETKAWRHLARNKRRNNTVVNYLILLYYVDTSLCEAQSERPSSHGMPAITYVDGIIFLPSPRE